MPESPSQRIEYYAPDNVVGGGTQLVSETGTLAGGQSLPRGAVIGRITASGKVTLSTAAATDGSQVPYGILYDEFDATAGDMRCGYYIAGEFNGHVLTLGAGHTLASVRDVLRAGGIYLKPVVPA